MADSEHNQAARRLARLLTSEHDAVTCTVCLESLEPYVAVQLAGEDYRARFPSVADHLDRCVECAEAYALTYDDLTEASQPSLDHSPPAPDFSFLEPYATGVLTPAELRRRRKPGLPELIATALTPLAQGLRIQLSQALLTSAPPQAALLLRDAAEAAPLAELLIDEPAPGIARLKLRIYAAASDLGRRDLRLRVELSDRDWPDLAGIAITVQRASGSQSIFTDAWGEAVLTDLAAEELETLLIEVHRP